MKNSWPALMSIPILFVLSGCATIVSGTTQKVSLSTQPSGAEAKADGNLTLKTPALITLERKMDHTIEVSKEGYKTVTVYVHRAFNEMATGNVLLGGIIGAGIDAGTGSGNKLIPERIDLVLEEGAGSADAKFASTKDQEFYEQHILKQKAESDKKVAEKDAASAAKEATRLNSASDQMASAPATGNNFAAKAR